MNVTLINPVVGVADSNIQFSSAENPELFKALSFKLGIGQKIALHASPTVLTYALLISAFPVHSIAFSPISLLHVMMCDVNRE